MGLFCLKLHPKILILGCNAVPKLPYPVVALSVALFHFFNYLICYDSGCRQNHYVADKIRRTETVFCQTMHTGRRPTCLHSLSAADSNRNRG